ncbi:hypothetical protein A3715_10535 [Oleiphilus sp. HI0009]|nr:hypothetical protein A3715_22655 [Oleiphilus sp. HI0009]KZX78296.1 hypothetical protein A3715_10535 [Oleiphilus sp. HI0009]
MNLKNSQGVYFNIHSPINKDELKDCIIFKSELEMLREISAEFDISSDLAERCVFYIEGNSHESLLIKTGNKTLRLELEPGEQLEQWICDYDN